MWASELVQTIGILSLEAVTAYAKANYLEQDELLVNTMVNIAEDVVLAMFTSNARLSADNIK